MHTASLGYELQIAPVTAIVLMAPGAVLLLLLERFLKSEYLVLFGRLEGVPVTLDRIRSHVWRGSRFRQVF